MNNFKRLFFILILMVLFSSFYAKAEDEFIKTTELRDTDISDEYQKNYTQGDSTISNLYNNVEWLDKKNGEAKVTIRFSQSFNIPVNETTAVYAFITCNVHGFSEALAKKNILYLLENYDHVDLVSVYGNTASSINIYEDISLDNVDQILNEASFGSNKHYSSSIYTGLYQYLFGSTDSTTQVRNPSAIYVSLDTLTTYSSDSKVSSNVAGITDYTYDCWDLLKQYQREGRYYSMTGYDDSDTYLPDGYNFMMQSFSSSSSHVFTGQLKDYINTVIGLVDPSVFPGIGVDYSLLDNVETKSISSKELFKGNFNGGNFTYSEDLQSQAPTIITNSLVITDFIKDYFEIVSYNSENDNINILVDGNQLTATLENYISDDEIEIEIYLKLKDEYKDELTNKVKWMVISDDGVKGELTIQGKTPYTNIAYSPKLSIYDPKIIIKNPETTSSIIRFVIITFISLCMAFILIRKIYLYNKTVITSLKK